MNEKGIIGPIASSISTNAHEKQKLLAENDVTLSTPQHGHFRSTPAALTHSCEQNEKLKRFVVFRPEIPTFFSLFV